MCILFVCAYTLNVCIATWIWVYLLTSYISKNNEDTWYKWTEWTLEIKAIKGEVCCSEPLHDSLCDSLSPYSNHLEQVTEISFIYYNSLVFMYLSQFAFLDVIFANLIFNPGHAASEGFFISMGEGVCYYSSYLSSPWPHFHSDYKYYTSVLKRTNGSSCVLITWLCVCVFW